MITASRKPRETGASARTRRLAPQFGASSAGFSLVELMVAMLLGLFLVAGVIAVFEATSRSNHAQQSLARVLENGRYASQYLGDELRMAGAQYCSAYANALPRKDPTTQELVSPVRGLVINVDTTQMDQPLPSWMPKPADPKLPYVVDPGVFVRGYECDTKGACSPKLPTKDDEDVNIVPDAGTDAGKRALGTDVLTIRYLAGGGSSIASDATVPGSSVAAGVDAGTAVKGKPLNFGTKKNPKDPDQPLAMIADCGNAELFVPELNGTLLSIDKKRNVSTTFVSPFLQASDSHVFNFTQDFVSVTYYIGLMADNDQPGRVVSSLMRIVNGGAPEVVVDGVERLDFTYTVIDGSNRTHFLTAAEVDKNSGGLECPPVRIKNAPPSGCLWRGVQGIDVSMLMNSVVDDGAGNEPFHYSADKGGKVQALGPEDLLPSGLKAGRMARREFRLLASTHNISH